MTPVRVGRDTAPVTLPASFSPVPEDWLTDGTPRGAWLPMPAEIEVLALAEHSLTWNSWLKTQTYGLIGDVDAPDAEEQALARVTRLLMQAAQGFWLPHRSDHAARTPLYGHLTLGPEDSWDGALGWVAMLAGAPVDHGWLMPRISTTRRPHSLAEDEYVGSWWTLGAAGVLAAWRARVPSRLASLAFAAGLSPNETGDLIAAGTLDVERLWLLAGLRGWRIPPLPER